MTPARAVRTARYATRICFHDARSDPKWTSNPMSRKMIELRAKAM
jgi:hypothetical protein